MLQFVKARVLSVRVYVLQATLALLAVVAGSQSAFATSTVGDVGVDTAVLITDSTAELGPILLKVIGVGMGVALALLCYRWIKRFMKG